MQGKTTRRQFLEHTTETAALLAAVSAMGGVHAFADEPEEKLNLGIIGCGGMMRGHVNGLIDRKENVSFAWLCDIDPRQLDQTAKMITKHQSAAPKQTPRFEEVIADGDVDACIIATPHHWHTPIALAAMAAGKDVYVEKPISHVYNEGLLMMAAAEKHNRVVQQGIQMRSSPVTMKAEKLLKEGILGEIKVARAWTAELRNMVAPVPDSVAAAGVDYDRWLGPAPKRPFNPQRFHGSWRMFRDYGNGEIGDDGIHDLDMATWGLGIDSVPRQITARGGRMLPGESASDYPDNMHVTYEYPDGKILVYENYPFTAYGLHGFDNGNVFYGTEGYMVFSRRGAFSVFLGPKNTPGPTEGKEIRGQNGYAEHMRDFLTAVRKRTPTRASARTAHLSCSLVHLGDIAYQTRGQLDFDAETNRFVDCNEANDLLTKEYRAPYVLPS